MKTMNKILCFLPVLLLSLACGDGSLSPVIEKPQIRISIAEPSRQTNDGTLESTKQINFLKQSEDWNDVHVAVIDLSEYDNESSMRQDPTWDEYHEAVHQWELGANGVVSWGGLKKPASYFPMIVNQALDIEGEEAIGIVNAAIGLNHVFVGLTQGDQVIYGAKQIVTAVEGEVTTVHFYPERWAAEEAVTLTRIEVTPAQVTLGNGEIQNFTATAHYSNGSSTVVTSQTSWSTEPGTSGSIDASNGTFTADARQTGTETVTGTYEGVSDQSVVTVTASTLPVNEMIMIYGGTFQMGSTSFSADEQPEHSVTVGDFAMFKYEMTQATWEAVMGTNPSQNKATGLPVENISWMDAIEFCNALSERENLTPCYTINGSDVTCDFLVEGFRLPTEAEWEYAARGGTWGNQTTYSGSDDVDAVAWYTDNSNNETQIVGTKSANELTLYDMSGNVGEWCWDWYDENYYSVSPAREPKGPDTGSVKVYRGGAYTDPATWLRVSTRRNGDPSSSTFNLGLRCVMTVLDPCTFKAMKSSPEEALFDSEFGE